jgi:hypothetical protein
MLKWSEVKGANKDFCIFSNLLLNLLPAPAFSEGNWDEFDNIIPPTAS